MFQAHYSRLAACIVFLTFGGSLIMQATSANAEETEGKLLSLAEIKNLLKSEQFADGSDVLLEFYFKATKVPPAAKAVESPSTPQAYTQGYDVLVKQMYPGEAAGPWMITERIEECLAMEPKIEAGAKAQLVIETGQFADGSSYEETIGYLGNYDFPDADYIAQALRQRCQIEVNVEEHRTRMIAADERL